MDVAEILRQVDRGQISDTSRYGLTPESAADLLIGHIKLFLDQLVAVTHGMRPGKQRLMLTMEVYWEGCFRRRHLRRQCIGSLHAHPAFEQVTRSGELLNSLIYLEMKACGLEHPRDHAQEFMRRVRDVARQELIYNERQPRIRQSHYEWLDVICHRAQYRGVGPFVLR